MIDVVADVRPLIRLKSEELDSKMARHTRLLSDVSNDAV